MTALNRLPIVVIAICEAVMIYTATGVAKVAFTQLDAVYAAWYRVGFMALMLLAGISLGGENGGSFLIGPIAILIGGSMWGCYIVLGGKVATKGHPIDMLCWGTVLGRLMQSVFLVSLFGSFLPYPTDQVVVRRIPSARYSVVQSINPAMATFIALAFGEVPTLGECAGIALVIVAVIVTFSGDEDPA